MSPDFQKLAQFTNIYPIGHSEIFKIPRENDVVVTDPTNPRKGMKTWCFLFFHTSNSQGHFVAYSHKMIKLKYSIVNCV